MSIGLYFCGVFLEKMEWVRVYFGELLRLVNEMAPYLLLGFLFAGVLRVVFPKKLITRTMGKGNFRSSLTASLLGIPLPLCSCGVIPTGIGFFRSGASRGSTISFMISTPQTGVDSILATYSLLGWPLAVIRPVVALVTGVLGGVLGNRMERNNGITEEESNGIEEDPPRTAREVFRYGFVELLQDISRWLVIGILAAALLSVLIPGDFFTRNISSEYLAMFLMLAASVPLYVCATGSIPIAAVLLMKGLSPGAALVLLMAGPATNIATMAVIGNTLGRRSLWVYLLSIIGGALFFGTLVNEFIPRHWILRAIPATMQEGMHLHGYGWFQWLSTGLLVFFLINGTVQKYLERRKSLIKNSSIKSMDTQTYAYRVDGMTCSHCKANVERGLGALKGVTNVHADPDRNQVTLHAADILEEQVKETVEKLGYQFGGTRSSGR